jgi:hypothetical protein
MLHEFLKDHRSDLIERCRLKVAHRHSPSATPTELEHGIPLILNQLAEALASEGEFSMPAVQTMRGDSPDTPAWRESSRTAGLHGGELFKLGYTVGEVVHDYGDLCQAITEAAIANQALITVDEFHTLNRLLDNSIANAVSAFGILQQSSSHDARNRPEMHQGVGSLAEEQRKLLDTAIAALDALKRGNVGLMGATGAVLEDSLIRLRQLVDGSLPRSRPATGMVGSPAP